MSEIAEVTNAAVSIIAIDTIYRSSVFLDMKGIAPEFDDIGCAIEIIERRREDIRQNSIGGVLSAHQVAVDNICSAILGLLKKDPMDGWLLEFLQSDPEYTTHLGGIPDWLKPTE